MKPRSLPVPFKRTKKKNTSRPSNAIKKKLPHEYERDRVGKYAPYFRGNEILPIPEIVAEVEPKTLSFIITDLRTRKLAGIKKETFEELLKSASIPCRYFCRWSFAIWDVLLPSEGMAVNVTGINVSPKHFRLKPEYTGTRQIKVTVCSIPVQLNGGRPRCIHAYGSVGEVTPVRLVDRTAHDDFVLNVCLNKEGFPAIPHILTHKDQQMRLVVEDKRPLCRSCNQLGHLARNCPQKTTTNKSKSNNNNLYNNQSCSGTWGPSKQSGRRMNPGYQKKGTNNEDNHKTLITRNNNRNNYSRNNSKSRNQNNTSRNTLIYRNHNYSTRHLRHFTSQETPKKKEEKTQREKSLRRWRLQSQKADKQWGNQSKKKLCIQSNIPTSEIHPQPSPNVALQQHQAQPLPQEWLVGWVLWHINLCRLFNAKSIFMKIVLFTKNRFSMSTQFNFQKRFYFKLFSLV